MEGLGVWHVPACKQANVADGEIAENFINKYINNIIIISNNHHNTTVDKALAKKVNSEFNILTICLLCWAHL